MNRFKCSRKIMKLFIEKTDAWKWCRHITYFFLIYACLKPKRYHNWYLWYLLPTILVLQKRNKFDRISGCNYSFTIEKGQLIEWMAKIGLAYYKTNSIPLKKRIHCVKSVGIQSYSGPLFPAFGLNTEIWTGKCGPE